MAIVSVLVAAALLPTEPARAIGPESVAVVVNADSWASVAVANEYIHLRRIPAINVVYLHLADLPNFEIIDVETFRTRILGPVLMTLQQRKLAPQIDAIAYSADLPYAVNPAKDSQGKNLPRMITQLSSINGLTYLYMLVLNKDVRYLQLNSNLYFRRTIQDKGKVQVAPAAAFRAGTSWAADGTTTAPAGGGLNYLLSTMLAVTSGRGNSVREAVACLRSAAQADGTAPAGSVYFMTNGDIRSRTRQWGFAPAIEKLKKLGVRSAIAEGVLPQSKTDVAGLAAGSADFHWPSCKSKITPGSICEHLTSCGGEMHQRAGQTPISEWIRWGAAGSSGTVTEPYAIQAKFPTPLLHVYYASGSTLGEAFYQSVAGPYQLLIIGDILCRPWGKATQVAVEIRREAASKPATQATGERSTGIPPVANGAGGNDRSRNNNNGNSNDKMQGQDAPATHGRDARPTTPVRLAGMLKLAPKAAGGPAARQFELYVDGLRSHACPPGGTLTLNAGLMEDGYHELRVVSVGDDAVQSDGRSRLEAEVCNRGRRLELKGPSETNWPWNKPIPLSARMSGAREIIVLHNFRPVAKIAGEGGDAQVEAGVVGPGPAALQAVAVLADRPGTPSVVASRPIHLQIVPPPPLPALPGRTDLLAGLRYTGPGKSDVMKDLYDQAATDKLDIRKDQKFAIEGFIEAGEDDVYQFQTYFHGKTTLKIDGHLLGQSPGAGWRFLPVNLAKGLHSFRFEGQADRDKPRLDIRFGNRGARSLNDKIVKRVPEPEKK